MELARGASFAGIMLNACELFTCFEEEVDYIWMTLGDFTISKGLYLYSRYFIFVIHLQYFYYAPQFQNLDPTQPSPPGLASWVLYKFFVWQSLMGIVDFILCRRVYLIHNRRRRVLIFLCSIISGKAFLAAVTAVFAVRSLSHVSRDSVPITVAGHYMSVEALMQSLLVFMAYSGALLTSQGRSRIMYRLAETGTESFLTFAFLVAVTYIYFVRNAISVFLFPLLLLRYLIGVVMQIDTFSPERGPWTKTSQSVLNGRKPCVTHMLPTRAKSLRTRDGAMHAIEKCAPQFQIRAYSIPSFGKLYVRNPKSTGSSRPSRGWDNKEKD